MQTPIYYLKKDNLLIYRDKLQPPCIYIRIYFDLFVILNFKIILIIVFLIVAKQYYFFDYAHIKREVEIIYKMSN